MRVELGAGSVTKEAESDGERVRLGHEARALRACAHPGVVALLGCEDGDPPGRLVLTRLSGGSLADRGQPPVEALAGWAVATASTLADLHEMGWAHGALASEHVLLDEAGRPVLCGFSHAVGPDQPDRLGEAAAQDVARLAGMILDRLPPGADRRVVRLLARVAGDPLLGANGRTFRPRAAGAGHGRGRPLTARQFARRLIELVPDARLEPAPEQAGEPDSGHTPPGGPAAGAPVAHRRARLAAMACVIGTGAAFASYFGWQQVGSGRHPPGPATAPAGLMTLAAGDRYLLGGTVAPRLLTVEGRWGCGTMRPASLDPATGWLWEFARWPAPGSSLEGVPVAHVPGARGLGVRTAGSGCDALIVLGRSGSLLTVPAARMAVAP